VSAQRTRRELLRPAHASEPARLARLLALELMAVDAYTLALASGRLRPTTQSMLVVIHQQEVAHAAALARHVPAPAPPTSDDVVLPTTAGLQQALLTAGIHLQVAHVRDEHEWLGLLDRIEGALAGAHFRAVRQLDDAATATLSASILADEAQHQTVLSRLGHPRDVKRAVPFAIVPADASIQL
jgi:hypothetical protein